MKYSIDFFDEQLRRFKYLDQIDEITIYYNEQDTTLLDFMLAHSQLRFNVYLRNGASTADNKLYDLRIFEAIAETHPELNFAFKLDNYNSANAKVLVPQFKERNFKFFFGTHIKDFDMLYGLLELGVSDVYITNSLGFEIKQCAEAAHNPKYNAQIRVFPNVAQSFWDQTPAITKFFIRPEDVSLYEPYVDVMEFFGSNKNLATYYKIYTRDKKWSGNLKEIIQDFNEDIDNQCLLPNFAVRRLDCGKRCLKGKSCQICYAQQQLAKTLTENNLTLKTLNQKNKSKD